MSSAYLIDGRGPVVGEAAPGGKLHRAVVYRSGPDPWAGCGRAQRLETKSLALADDADSSRFCRHAGCMGSRAGSSRPRSPQHRHTSRN
ncbi:hypothetical protein [Streptomyces lancefieldiae]|uniref:Uncharacterized protein n=1 Tax=Streptomyces lancefieldiae TaxID=3075520 RepID=A0ABU3B225_9ACTN|nr:hypothetical protein [Streptomyces sp. DSM 40712]MDT0616185.1 hypothetical protein [Streptomyces sp. DSM 40712]